MRRFIAASAYLAFSLLLIAATASRSPGQESTATSWSGTLDVGAAKLRLEIDIIDSDGKFSGELRSLDQNNAKLELDKVSVNGKRLTFSVGKIGASFSGKISADGKVAKGKFKQSGRSFSLELNKTSEEATDAPTEKQKEVLKAAWIGKLDIGVMKPVMQFRVMELEDGTTTAYFDSITEGRTGFEATYKLEDKKLSFDVKEIKLTYRGTINEIGIAEGTWNQGGREFPLSLKSQKTEYDNENIWENRPQRPVGPFPYDAEEVKFENTDHDVTLAGTLTIPKKAGRHPAVILISGSGPQDRDESIMEHKPFLVLADYLSRRGIAVLRYDDRGAFESTGSFSKASSEDFAHDASAAVAFLKTHDRINPGQIGLAGHSEGGLIAPIVVSMRDDVAFVVLLAATGVNGEQIGLSQAEAMLRIAGSDEDEIATELKVSRAVLGVVQASKFGDDISEKLESALDNAIAEMPEDVRKEAGEKIRKAIMAQTKRLGSKWMRFFLSHDPATVISKMQCPTLAIVGEKDIQVLPDLNMPAIKKALTDGGNQDFEMVELEGLNHLFQKCDTGSMDEYVSIKETFNPVALKTIGDWIVAHTDPIE